MKLDLNEFLIKNRETAQIVYGVLLVVLIPLLIVINSVFIINKYNQTLDITLQREALTIGRSVYALITPDLGNPAFLQEDIDNLMWHNVQFQEMSILYPEGDGFKVVASSDFDSVGRLDDRAYYAMAWSQPDNDGLATDSVNLNKSKEEEKEEANPQALDRYWLVALPMNDENGSKKAILSMKISSKIIDDLTNYNRSVSAILLVGTVIVVVLFLLVAVRLWDYVLLFRKIQAVDRMKDEFISMASHELRSPVTGIKGYVSMLLEGNFGPLTAKVRQALEAVQNTSDRLASMVEDLLNVSRIEQGRINYDPKIQDPDYIIKEVIAEMAIQAQAKNLKLEYRPHELPLPMINIDAERFRQVIINLVNNAIKYTAEGTVEVSTEMRNYKMLSIKVRDTGIGISAADRARLFEKFFRAKNDRTNGIPGTGLGLWITKQLVVMMKGNITIDSVENTGTQVAVEFPIIK